MIDLKLLREDPERFIEGARLKGIDVDISRVIELDSRRRELQGRGQELRAEQNRLARESGREIGQLMGHIKRAQSDAERAEIRARVDALKERPASLKDEIQKLESDEHALQTELNPLLLCIPMPPDPDVPRGATDADNIEIRRWNSSTYDTTRTFEENRGFAPRTHTELLESLGLADFERGVKMAGSRSYVLTGMGMRLHQAVLRYAMDFITDHHGFVPLSVPVIVREECMEGTGFFPGGRDQTYLVEETRRGGGHDLYLTGTGEVGLMGFRGDEIIEEAELPLQYATTSTCFRREAGAAGRDTAGLYRIHQFDKVEQVVICRADEDESRAWHSRMIEIVENLLRSLDLPYRLLQCCTGDLGPKNADQIDIECWMPGRGDLDSSGRPTGAFGETHSASRLYDFQCRRLNLRYRSANGEKSTVFCHSLNNTVVASPRILVPILEMHQTRDGAVVIPEVLRPLVGGASLLETAVARTG